MNAKQYLKAYGDDATAAICKKAGTNLSYFKQCAYGQRVFSRKLATSLEVASGRKMTREELVFPELSEAPQPAAQANG